MAIWISTYKTVLNETLTRKTLKFVYMYIIKTESCVEKIYQKIIVGFLIKNIKPCRFIMIGILANFQGVGHM